jgi:hypothetical protein
MTPDAKQILANLAAWNTELKTAAQAQGLIESLIKFAEQMYLAGAKPDSVPVAHEILMDCRAKQKAIAAHLTQRYVEIWGVWPTEPDKPGPSDQPEP